MPPDCSVEADALFEALSDLPGLPSVMGLSEMAAGSPGLGVGEGELLLPIPIAKRVRRASKPPTSAKY